MKYTKEITIDIPDGVSDETAAKFLRETADKLATPRRTPRRGDVWSYGSAGIPNIYIAEHETAYWLAFDDNIPCQWLEGMDRIQEECTYVGTFEEVFKTRK